MLIKKPNVLLSAYSTLHSLNTVPGSTTSSCQRQQQSTRQQRGRGRDSRTYATIVGDHNDHHGESAKEPEHKWPAAPKGQTHPTPYQIFAMKTNADYTKARFYELVKMYHPDRPNGSPTAQQIKIERYRLIVAAHTILSDPVKRSAYDRFGAGWNGKAEVDANGRSTHPGPGPFTQSHGWSSDPIWQNATWEDWERFYAKRARESGDAKDAPPQMPVYMQNSYFILLVAVIALMGSSANYNRTQDAGTYFVEQRDLVHDRAAKELRKVRQEMGGMNSREERIQWFLRQREATMGTMAPTDIEAMREEKAQRVLEEPEVCRSDAVSEKKT